MKTIKSILMISSLLTLLVACNAKQQSTKTVNMSQKKMLIDTSEFTVNKTKAIDVKSSLGNPLIEDHNPDGRLLFVYQSICKVKAPECSTRFLFDENNVLTKIIDGPNSFPDR